MYVKEIKCIELEPNHAGYSRFPLIYRMETYQKQKNKLPIFIFARLGNNNHQYQIKEENV